MTRRCEQAALAFLFAGVLAMLACALWARFTQPSIVKRLPAQAQQAQAEISPAQSRISSLMAETAKNPGNVDALLELAQEFMSQGQPDAAGIEFVHNRRPEFLYLLISCLHHFFRGLREGIPELPDRRTHKEGDHIHAHRFRCMRGILHLLNSPLADFFRFSCHFRRCKPVQTAVVGIRERIRYTLSGKMIRNCPAIQVIFLQRVLYILHICRIFSGFFHIQMRG